MEDKVIVEGKTTVVECMASGSPKPKLEWLKDDKPLVASQRHFFAVEDQLLIIVQTKRSDEGKYTCKMSNTIGTEKGDSNVKVISLDNLNYVDGPSEYHDDSTTTGIIIIAVVCCVVGTSLVWVIIIYQTRKKAEEYSSTPTDETTLPEGTPSTPYHSSEKEGSSPPSIATHYTTSYSKSYSSFLGHLLPKLS